MQLQTLIKECQQQRLTAQKCLYEMFANRFFLVCRRYMKTDSEAEEMVQNGFLKIFNGIPVFIYNNEAACIGWMKKVMVNECLQSLRKKNSFLFVAEHALSEYAIADDVLTRLSEADIFKLITQIPLGYRTVFNMYCIEGYSHQEIAAILGISEGTSKSQLNRGRKHLQQLLNAEDQYASKAR